MSDDVQRVRDILESIHNIERYATRGRVEFESDELIFTWIVPHLIIIGEAAGRVSAKTQAEAASVPWRDIVAM